MATTAVLSQVSAVIMDRRHQHTQHPHNNQKKNNHHHHQQQHDHPCAAPVLRIHLDDNNDEEQHDTNIANHKHDTNNNTTAVSTPMATATATVTDTTTTTTTPTFCRDIEKDDDNTHEQQLQSTTAAAVVVPEEDGAEHEHQCPKRQQRSLHDNRSSSSSSDRTARNVSILDISGHDDDDDDDDDEEEESIGDNSNDDGYNNKNNLMFEDLHVEFGEDGDENEHVQLFHITMVGNNTCSSSSSSSFSPRCSSSSKSLSRPTSSALSSTMKETTSSTRLSVKDVSATSSNSSMNKSIKTTTTTHTGSNKGTSTPSTSSPSSSRGIMNIGGLSLFSVTDKLVDSLCLSSTDLCNHKEPTPMGGALSNSSNHSHNNGKKRGQRKQKSLKNDDNNNSSMMQDVSSIAILQCDWPRSGSKNGCTITNPTFDDIMKLLNCTSSASSQSDWGPVWSIRSTTMTTNSNVQLNQNDNSIIGNRPARASMKKRLKRLHSLRMMSHGARGSTRHGVTFADQPLNTSFTTTTTTVGSGAKGGGTTLGVEFSNMNDGMMNRNSDHVVSKVSRHDDSTLADDFVLDKSYTMIDETDMDDDGCGKDTSMMFPMVADGYDSDPELNRSTTLGRGSMKRHRPHTVSQELPTTAGRTVMTSNTDSVDVQSRSSLVAVECDEDNQGLYSSSPVSTMEPVGSFDIYCMDDKDVRRSVQATLNSTWTLTWHPNPDNVKDFAISHQPICTNIWLERGTVISNSGVVIEPAFMWRDAYQNQLTTRRQLNASTLKPWTMRLLNACRISPCQPSAAELDRTKYPMARQSSCFFLKSCDGQEFLLEAQSPEEMMLITQQWKMAVARFASLAVTEDVSNIAKEFFHPTLDSQVLTVPDDDF